jgi:hypothetical protein
MKKYLLALLMLVWATTAHAQTLASSSLTTNGQSLSVALGRGGAPVEGLSVQVTGTWTGTLTFQGSLDGSTFVSVLTSNATSGATTTTTTANGVFAFSNVGYHTVRVSATAAMTGTAVVSIVQGYSSGGGGGSASSVSGSLTNDNAASTSNRVATLPVITETSAPTRTNGRDAALSGTAGGSIRVMIADAAGAALSVATDATHDSAASTTGPQVMMGADSTTPTAVADGDAVRRWANLDGAAAGFQVAHTLGGCTPGSSISTAAVMETEIKATAGQLYSIVVTAIDATAVFARLYNDTAANTDENDTPVARFAVPSATTAGGFALPIPIGMAFSTAITLRITTGGADTDTGALTANEVFVSYCYK